MAYRKDDEGKFFEEDHYTGTTPAKITRAIFDDNFLIIDGVYSRDYKEGGRDYRIKVNFKYGINLSKLSENVYEYGKYIATNGNFIEEIRDWRKYRWQNGEYQLIDSKPSKEYISYMRAVQINDKVEPEILDRFKKALKHYTTLMTSKKSNETF